MLRIYSHLGGRGSSCMADQERKPDTAKPCLFITPYCQRLVFSKDLVGIKISPVQVTSSGRIGKMESHLKGTGVAGKVFLSLVLIEPLQSAYSSSSWAGNILLLQGVKYG